MRAACQFACRGMPQDEIKHLCLLTGVSIRRFLRPFVRFLTRVCQTFLMALVRVAVTLKPSLLDSAGRTVAGALEKLGYEELESVRIGKLIELQVEPYDEARVREMCDRLLANPVIEDYRIEEVVA